MTAYGIALRHCFGMGRKATNAYFADTSGSCHKPILGSNVKPKDRVAYQTHESLFHILLGDGLAPLTDRFESCLSNYLHSLEITKDWVIYPDLLEFFEDNLGSAILEAIFGAALQSQNPGFVRDLWAFDKVVMSLAKRLPWFCIPKAYGLRNRLLQSVKNWHAYARSKSTEGSGDEENDTDLFWGSKRIRDRNRMLLDVVDQDYDSVASTDLGFIWASVTLLSLISLYRTLSFPIDADVNRTVTNVVPSSMTLTSQVFSNKAICSEVRQVLGDTIKSTTPLKFDLKLLEKKPLLLSMYAETLRFGVQIHIPRTAPHQDLGIGDLIIPKNKILLVNTWLAHTDEKVWNTKNAEFPLSSFWPQRFLVDLRDPFSGPTVKQRRPDNIAEKVEREAEGATFSTEGLEGAWIPFGGKMQRLS